MTESAVGVATTGSRRGWASTFWTVPGEMTSISSPDAARGINGGPGDDLLRNDVLGLGSRYTGHVYTTMNGDAGADRLYGSPSGGTQHDSMYGHDGRDVLVAGAGVDGLEGGPGFDITRGGAGDDGFTVRAWDHETLKGGPGQNSLGVEATRRTAVRVDLPAGFLKPVGSTARTALIGKFRHVVMDGLGDHVVIGNGLDNEVYTPRPGSNRIEGRGGADLLVGGGQSDYLDGGAPNGPSDPDRIDGSGSSFDTGLDTCLNAGEMHNCEVFP